jgi:hypothetical protein
MRKKSWIISGVILALAAGYVYSTPYITLFMLQRAIERKSAKEVVKFIDFPDVRDSLRSQLAEHMKDQFKGDQQNAGFAELSAGIGSALGATFIDLAIQPSNLQDWLNGTDIFKGRSKDMLISLKDFKSSNSNATVGYLDPEIFEVRLPNASPIRSILLERRNVIFWKVNRVGVDLLALGSASQPNRLRTTETRDEEFKDGYYFGGGDGYEPDHSLLVEGGRVTHDGSYDKYGCTGRNSECEDGGHMSNTVYKSVGASKIARTTPDGKSVVLTWNKGINE